MASKTAQIVGLSVCLMIVLPALPALAEPFFVRVYGRTYKVDPRYPPGEPKGPKPQEAMKALPSDLARGPGYKPSHEQVLSEVEERAWIAQRQLDEKLDATAISRNGVNIGANMEALSKEITGALAAGTAQGRLLELQPLYDRHRALNLLARDLRHSMDLPMRVPDAGFSRPKLPAEIEASYRDLKFDPLEAYYSFRRVKAAFRSGDANLLSRVARYPLVLTGKVRRTIRNSDQLIAARELLMDPRVREIVAQSTFETVFVRDKGMMLGQGEVWITPLKGSFGLGAVNLD